MVALWGYIGNKRNHSLSIKHSCRLLLNFCQGKNSSNAQKELKKNSACNHFQALEREGEHIIEGEKGKSFVGGQIYLLNKWEWTDQP
jgi:hypothetical protein